MAANAECQFLLKMLVSDEDTEEAAQRAEQTQKRMQYIMLRWAKASMVTSYYTWKDFALIPENKVNRLVTQLDSFGFQQQYETPPTGIIHHAKADNFLLFLLASSSNARPRPSGTYTLWIGREILKSQYIVQ